MTSGVQSDMRQLYIRQHIEKGAEKFLVSHGGNDHPLVNEAGFPSKATILLVQRDVRKISSGRMTGSIIQMNIHFTLVWKEQPEAALELFFFMPIDRTVVNFEKHRKSTNIEMLLQTHWFSQYVNWNKFLVCVKVILIVLQWLGVTNQMSMLKEDYACYVNKMADFD